VTDEGAGRAGPTIRTLASLLVAAVVLAALVASAGPGQVLAELRRADPRFVLGGVASALGAVLAWSEAQRLILGGVTGTASGRRFRIAYLAGDFMKQVLPMGHVSGPALMALTVSRAVDASYERTLASITVSDLLNLLASVALATTGVAVLAVGRQTAAVEPFLGGLAAAAVGVLALVLALTRFRPSLLRGVVSATGRLRALLRRVGGRPERLFGRALDPARIDDRLREYFESLDAAATDRRRAAVAGAIAVTGWVLYALPLYLCALAVGRPVPLGVALVLVPLAGLATWLPSPGGLGGVEVALTAGLVVGGFGVGPATALVLLYRLCSYWSVVAVDGLAMLAFTASN